MLLEPGGSGAARMGDADPDWPEAAAGQVLANPHEGRHPEFHLMPIGVAGDAHIAEADLQFASLFAAQPHALVGDGVVPLDLGQGLAKRGG
jgi:hypothetical protein